MSSFRFVVICFVLMLAQQSVRAQKPGQVIDQVVAVVGSNVIMQSEIEMEFRQIDKEFEGELPDTMRCAILQQKIQDYILLTKAQLDSVPVNEDRVEAELEKRIRYFARQFPGGEKGMEEFYGKSISQIKADNREKIRQSMLIQEMQGKAMKDVKITPNDVRRFYNEIPTDSIPFYSAEVEVAQLVIEPKVSAEAKQIAYEKITELRNRIVNGDNFNTLAVLYSDDKASATNGGELGYFGRGEMVPEFEAAAYRLKPDSISKIIETKYGYHILKLVDRKGDNINVRHILVRPQIFKSDVQKARTTIDSIVWLVKIDSLTFEEAAKKFSDDEDTKGNGGFITEGRTGTSRVPVDELDKQIYFRLDGMKPGDITEPELITLAGPDKQQAWRVLYLKTEYKPHRANLRDDYQKFQAMANQRKQSQALVDYISRARKELYIRISPQYSSCRGVQQLLIKK